TNRNRLSMGGAGSEGTAACSDESVSSFMSSMTDIERNTWVERREGRDRRDGREEPADSPASSRPFRPSRPFPPYLCLRGNVNFDLPRLGFLAQREPDGQ